MAMYFAFAGAFVGAFVGLPTCFGRLRMGSEQGFYLNCSVRTKWFRDLAMLKPRKGHGRIVGKKHRKCGERARAILDTLVSAP
jgi:hypothetical protein